jgi:hypothetical protein
LTVASTNSSFIMTYPNRASAFQNALKHKEERKQTAARKKDTEQENAAVRCNLDLADDYLLVLPDDWCDHQHQHDTSDGEVEEGGLLSFHEGQVTLAQLLDMEPGYENLEVDDEEERSGCWMNI